MFSLDKEHYTLCERGHTQHTGSAQQLGRKKPLNLPSYISLVEKYSSDSVSASSLSTSRRSERRVMDTSRAQSEPVLQSSVPAGGRISAFTVYKVWARGEEKDKGDV